MMAGNQSWQFRGWGFSSPAVLFSNSGDWGRGVRSSSRSVLLVQRGRAACADSRAECEGGVDQSRLEEHGFGGVRAVLGYDREGD